MDGHRHIAYVPPIQANQCMIRGGITIKIIGCRNAEGVHKVRCGLGKKELNYRVGEILFYHYQMDWMEEEEVEKRAEQGSQ